jgi:hypothetical protein
MNDYQTVFVVLQKSPPWWLSAVVPTAIAAFTVLAIVAFVKYKTQRVAVVVAYVAMLFMAMTLSPAGVSDMYARARDTYVRGDYSIAEGTVANFLPMPYSGHQNETFSVNGVGFSYSDYEVVPCFNNTASHGGPIRDGLRVRIAYSGDCILKLEVAAR